MTSATPQSFIERYESALDNTPEEVRAFLWSDAYKGIIAGIVKTCSLTPEQGKAVSDVIFDLCIGATDQPEAELALADAGISDESQQTIFALALEYVINPSIVEAEETAEAEKDESVPSPQIASAPSPADVLANLGARLSQSSVIVPSKRDYSVAKPAATEPIAPSAPVSNDPYREVPEK